MRVTGRLALNIIRSHRQAHTPKGHANPTPPQGFAYAVLPAAVLFHWVRHDPRGWDSKKKKDTAFAW